MKGNVLSFKRPKINEGYHFYERGNELSWSVYRVTRAGWPEGSFSLGFHGSTHPILLQFRRQHLLDASSSMASSSFLGPNTVVLRFCLGPFSLRMISPGLRAVDTTHVPMTPPGLYVSVPSCLPDVPDQASQMQLSKTEPLPCPKSFQSQEMTPLKKS